MRCYWWPCSASNRCGCWYIPFGIIRGGGYISRLAALGGGALAAGGAGMAGGTLLVQAIAGGVGVLGAGIATNAAEGVKVKKQNQELRDELHQQNIDNATKQKVIQQLNNKVEELKQALADEKKKTDCNEDRIRLLQDQLDDILRTLEVAKAA